MKLMERINEMELKMQSTPLFSFDEFMEMPEMPNNTQWFNLQIRIAIFILSRILDSEKFSRLRSK